MGPDLESDPPCSVDEEEANKKTGKKSAKRKKDSASKLPAGFALMHGFSATNVGKNRLTVRNSLVIYLLRWTDFRLSIA